MNRPIGVGYDPPVRDSITQRAILELRRRLNYVAGTPRNADNEHRGLWNDLRVPLSAVTVAGAKAPTYLQWRDDGAGSTGLFGYSFSATTEEEVFFDAQLPHQYAEGSRIAPHIHFSVTSTPTVGQTLRFGLEYTWANVGGNFGTTTYTYAEYTFTASDAAYDHLIAGFDPDIEQDMKVSAMIGCRLFRDTTSPNDTYTGEPIVHEIDFHYVAENLGSVNEFSK